MQIGMIGLGRMGANMVRRLLKNGQTCVVFDRSLNAVKDLVKEKATGATSLADLVMKLDRYRLHRVLSDASWKTAPGPIVFSCIYGGEDYDARKECAGWDQPGFDASGWTAAQECAGPGGRLTTRSAPPIRVKENLPLK